MQSNFAGMHLRAIFAIAGLRPLWGTDSDDNNRDETYGVWLALYSESTLF